MNIKPQRLLKHLSRKTLPDLTGLLGCSMILLGVYMIGHAAYVHLTLVAPEEISDVRK